MPCQRLRRCFTNPPCSRIAQRPSGPRFARRNVAQLCGHRVRRLVPADRQQARVRSRRSARSRPIAAGQALATWKSQLSNAVILGFSSGIGSGWSGTFDGAVDNIGWNIGGNVSSYNFEVSPVPEPSGYVLALFSLGVIAAFARRRSSPRA